LDETHSQSQLQLDIAKLEGSTNGISDLLKSSLFEKYIFELAAKNRLNLIDQFYSKHGEWLFKQLFDFNVLPSKLSGWIENTRTVVAALFLEPNIVGDNSYNLQQWIDYDASKFFHHILKSQKNEKFTLSLLQPTEQALSLLDKFTKEKHLRLEKIDLSVENDVAVVTFLNESCLNAEDNELIRDLEIAVDLILLCDDIKVGVLRGGKVSHPKYKDKRVFSAGINLKHLSSNNISYVDFLLQREFGYIHKLIRGITTVCGEGYVHTEKPWLAVVETFAIGGGMQLLLACDMVIADRGSYVCLPAVKEGIVPGVANMRLANLTSTRLAQQVILLGKKIATDDEFSSIIYDQVHASENMDWAIPQAARTLASESVIANRRMLRLSHETVRHFNAYMSEFVLIQVERMYSADVLLKSSRFSTPAAESTD